MVQVSAGNISGSTSSLEQFFQRFREGVLGYNQVIRTPYHDAIRVVYTDWTASGRCYADIEEKLQREIFPLVANTHTDTTSTGSAMTYAYHRAQKLIKQHVNAGPDDVLICSGAGMTGVVNKLQRMLGLRCHERHAEQVRLEDKERPVVFISHMEHHSNQTSWLETLAEVVVIPPTEDCLFSLDNLRAALAKYADRSTKIAAITSCSNVTGIFTPYLDVAQLMHENGGLCFVDFACSAPYVDIDMHPDDASGRYLDAIYFSPHKFLGGPGATGVLVFNKKLYKNRIPDNPGGGTVDWTNPWGEHKYIDDIEAREDGGTPAFLQTIRAAMAMQLKERMGVANIQAREEELLQRIWQQLDAIPNLTILAGEQRDRLGVVSFYIDGLHYNVAVKLLNDRYGVQTRGGCSCAGTYGHYLLNVAPDTSQQITSKINEGDCTLKPGWVRFSIHPTLTNEEVDYACNAIREVAANYKEWVKDYDVDFAKNHIQHRSSSSQQDLYRKLDGVLSTF